MAETSKGIEDIVERFYSNIKNFSNSKSGEYRLVNSRARGNENYFELGFQIPVIFGQKSYVQTKFDEIIQQYYSSGLENAAKDYAVTKISNNWLRRRIKIQTPEGELDIRAVPSFWRYLCLGFFVLLPFLLKSEYRIKARFKRYQRHKH